MTTNVTETALQAPKLSEEGGGAPASGARSEIPLQPVEKTMVTQVVPLQPMEDCIAAGSNFAAHGGPRVRAGGPAALE